MTKSEAQTRSKLIDKQLEKSGWNVKNPTQVIEEFNIQTILPKGSVGSLTPYDGHQFSDYVLLGKNGRPLAVVEAKKSSKDAAIVEKVENLKSRYQQNLIDLESLYDALSQKAFKGELDLSRVVLPVGSTTEDTESMESLNRETSERPEKGIGVSA